MTIQEIYRQNGVSPEVYAFGEKGLNELKPRFERIDEMAELNQGKVILAMRENRSCWSSPSWPGWSTPSKRPAFWAI